MNLAKVFMPYPLAQNLLTFGWKPMGCTCGIHIQANILSDATRRIKDNKNRNKKCLWMLPQSSIRK